MAEEITTKASEVWSYYHTHQEELEKNMHLIASNQEYGIEIYVTSGDKNLPSIVVLADNSQVYEEGAVTADDCEKTVTRIYDDYLTNKVIGKLLSEDDIEVIDDEELDEEMMIEDREAELDAATYDFLFTVLSGGLEGYYNERDINDICDDCKEHFLEYIARKYEIEIYRPMYVEYDNKEVVLEEYPYDCIEFEDEDNPIYQP